MRTLRQIFPGCGCGLCMPCGGEKGVEKDYYITQTVGNVDLSICRTHKENGCPDPIPEPRHNFNEEGICASCGYEPRYITDDGKLFSSIALARKAGYDVSRLTVEDELIIRDSLTLDDLTAVYEKHYSVPEFIFAPGWVNHDLFKKLVEKKIDFAGVFTYHGSLRRTRKGNRPGCYQYGYAVDGGEIVTINQVLNNGRCPF
ncbi:hypothetical protein KY316_02895 [Candidatus Woesearchaeota archaeon]|nr:hypothetical protein [Candidatus Woesearchaeota archaeon]